MSEKAAQTAKEKGNTAFKANDFPTAIGHYSAAVVADPKNPTYPLNRAAAYLKLGKNEDAERDCSTVLGLDAKNVKAVFRRGQARVGLEKFADALTDFTQVLKLDPANDTAKQEVKKLEEILLKQKRKPKMTIPIEVPAIGTSVSHEPSLSAASSSKPKRKRIPITIVEPASTLPQVPPATSIPERPSTDDDFMKPVSSRPLSTSQTANAIPIKPSTPPSTFKEAKEVRETQRPKVRGGIFRPDGRHTIIGSKSSEDEIPKTKESTGSIPIPPSTNTISSVANGKVLSGAPMRTPTSPVAPQSVSAANGSSKPPMTLFTFSKTWETLKTPQERWALFDTFPPPCIPSLFQTSLEASMLVSLLTTFLVVMRSYPHDTDLREKVKQYMFTLAHVPRFSTVVLFMSKQERALVGDVWGLVGKVGQDENTRKAWGIS